MIRKVLLALWAGLFIICAILGFIPEPMESLEQIRRTCALVFFLPPFGLLWAARKQKHTDTMKLLRGLAVSSLGLTALMLMANFATVAASETVGDMLYVMLVILSTPMICAGRWLVSLFLWACLLVASHKEIKKNG